MRPGVECHPLMLGRAEINCPARTELTFLSPINIFSWSTWEFIKCGCFLLNLLKYTHCLSLTFPFSFSLFLFLSLSLSLSISLYKYMYIYVYLYIYMYIHIYVYICIYICTSSDHFLSTNVVLRAADESSETGCKKT